MSPELTFPKGTLFFDCDGFLFDTIPAHIAYFSEKYGFTATLEDFHDSPKLNDLVKKYRPSLPVTYESVYTDLGKNFITSQEWHKDVQPMKNMPEVVQKLSLYYKIYIVTARFFEGKHVVEKLVDSFIPGTISGYHYVWRSNHLGDSEKRPKKDFILEHCNKNPIAFFDDTLKEVLEVDQLGLLNSYLFDPYHSYDNDPRITEHKVPRVHSWEEIGELLLRP